MKPTKVKFIFFVMMLFINGIFAQTAKNKLFGKITIAGSAEPLIGVNIYINNSTIGTTTNKDGFYILYIPDGRYEIVASIIGFQTESKFIYVSNGSDKQLDFTLKEKIYEINQIQIEDQFSDEWYKKLNVFKAYFLGHNDFSVYCTIENEKDIFFSGDYNSIFKANSYNPLKIRNDALGYLIECTIINFEIDNKNNFCTYSLKTKFIDLSDIEPTKKTLWIVNRRSAYVGSLRHFLFTAITKTNLGEFDVALVNKTDYKEKGIIIKSGSEIIQSFGENPDYLLSFNGLLRVKFKYSLDYSWLKIAGNDSYINNNGYLTKPLSVIQFGNWAYYGISKTLPLDFISF